jgi:hypothetical protein
LAIGKDPHDVENDYDYCPSLDPCSLVKIGAPGEKRPSYNSRVSETLPFPSSPFAGQFISTPSVFASRASGLHPQRLQCSIIDTGADNTQVLN